MQKRELIRRLRDLAKQHGVEFVERQGRGRAGHEMWSFNGRSVGIPRHNEINEHTARAILRDAEDTVR